MPVDSDVGDGSSIGYADKPGNPKRKRALGALPRRKKSKTIATSAEGRKK